MSNRLFQGTIHQMKDAIDRTIGVVDSNGIIICCSDLRRIGENDVINVTKELSSFEAKVIGGKTYMAIGVQMHPDAAVFVDGDDDAAANYARLIAVALNGIKQYYDEKYDRSNFIKNVILDNILPGDIYLKTREFGFNNEVPRCVLLVRTQDRSEMPVSEALQKLFPDKQKDLIININETDIALVKELRAGNEMKDLEALAQKEEIELELIGLCTDICVVVNALLLKTAIPEVKISVDASCCAGVTPLRHQAALETMRSCQIAVKNG